MAPPTKEVRVTLDNVVNDEASAEPKVSSYIIREYPTFIHLHQSHNGQEWHQAFLPKNPGDMLKLARALLSVTHGEVAAWALTAEVMVPAEGVDDQAPGNKP